MTFLSLLSRMSLKLSDLLLFLLFAAGLLGLAYLMDLLRKVVFPPTTAAEAQAQEE